MKSRKLESTSITLLLILPLNMLWLYSNFLMVYSEFESQIAIVTVISVISGFITSYLMTGTSDRTWAHNHLLQLLPIFMLAPILSILLTSTGYTTLLVTLTSSFLIGYFISNILDSSTHTDSTTVSITTLVVVSVCTSIIYSYILPKYNNPLIIYSVTSIASAILLMYRNINFRSATILLSTFLISIYIWVSFDYSAFSTTTHNQDDNIQINEINKSNNLDNIRDATENEKYISDSSNVIKNNYFKQDRHLAINLINDLHPGGNSLFINTFEDNNNSKNNKRTLPDYCIYTSSCIFSPADTPIDNINKIIIINNKNEELHETSPDKRDFLYSSNIYTDILDSLNDDGIILYTVASEIKFKKLLILSIQELIERKNIETHNITENIYGFRLIHINSEPPTSTYNLLIRKQANTSPDQQLIIDRFKKEMSQNNVIFSALIGKQIKTHQDYIAIENNTFEDTIKILEQKESIKKQAYVNLKPRAFTAPYFEKTFKDIQISVRQLLFSFIIILLLSLLFSSGNISNINSNFNKQYLPAPIYFMNSTISGILTGIALSLVMFISKTMYGNHEHLLTFFYIAAFSSTIFAWRYTFFRKNISAHILILCLFSLLIIYLINSFQVIMNITQEHLPIILICIIMCLIVASGLYLYKFDSIKTENIFNDTSPNRTAYIYSVSIILGSLLYFWFNYTYGTEALIKLVVYIFVIKIGLAGLFYINFERITKIRES